MVCLSPASLQTLIVQYLTHLQFSFFGISLAHHVWLCEVNSIILKNLYLHELIVEQIHKSLQGEEKTKLVCFCPESWVEKILEQLDQFCGNQGAATRAELLSLSCNVCQQKSDEVSM